MERRRAERVKTRLTCVLIIGDRRHPGIVLDISETGLFIQTSAYRVRVKQTSGLRSRTLRITAASEEEAKVAASASLDEGWEILAVDPVAA